MNVAEMDKPVCQDCGRHGFIRGLIQGKPVLCEVCLPLGSDSRSYGRCWICQKDHRLPAEECCPQVKPCCMVCGSRDALEWRDPSGQPVCQPCHDQNPSRLQVE